MSKERFVNEAILVKHLPIFFGGSKTEEELDKMIDFIEETLILEKAKEISLRRTNEDAIEYPAQVAEETLQALYDMTGLRPVNYGFGYVDRYDPSSITAPVFFERLVERILNPI